MDQNRCLLDVIDNPQLLQSFLESESNAETNNIAPNTLANAINNVNTATATTSTSTTTITTITTNSTTPTTLATTPLSPSTSSLEDSKVQLTFDNNGNKADRFVEEFNFDYQNKTSVNETNVDGISEDEQKSDATNNFSVTVDEQVTTAISETVKPEPSSVEVTSNNSFQSQPNMSSTTEPIISSPYVVSTPISTLNSTVTTSTTTSTTTTITTTTTTTTASKTANSTAKRAPKKSTPRASKAKNKATSQPPPPPTSTQQQNTVQPQFNSSGQQQLVFQTNNSGIRQPAILTSSSMATTLGGMPQQQRVIQIQTANGPMYFAIAPGPAMNNNSMINQLPGMQSQQYPSQQICFQPNSTVMINRPQLSHSNQQQQSPTPTRPPAEYLQSNSSIPTSQSERSNQYTPDIQQSRCLTSPQAATSPQQQIRLQSPIIQYNGPNQANHTTMSNQTTTANGLTKSPQLQNQKFSSSQPGPIILQNRTTQGFSQQQPSQTTQQPQQLMLNSQNNNTIVNGSQLIQSANRGPSPMVAGQSLAIPGQQNSQQQHIVLPSSQQMMMPRMSNQLILNRPINSSGQLLPGQQQFIQIQTPNGPMLLALPAQTAQTINNPMIDYNNQVQQLQQQQQQPLPQSQPLAQQQAAEPSDTASPKKQNTSNFSKQASNTKSGLDLADLLLDCGILPEERMNASHSPSSMRASQSPSIPQINSPMTTPQISSPMSSMDSSSLSNSSPQQPLPNYAGQPLQQQPIRITIGPDGQMIMQPNVYGTIRPVLANSLSQPHLNSMNSTTILPSSSPMITLTSSPLTPNAETPTDTKKSTVKGKGTPTKRSRSKKSDLDKFPILKTPKIAQQQQQKQQQLQAVTVVPMTVLVGDQNKVLGGPDVKVNVGQIGSSSQVSLAKIVTPVMQTALQPLVNSNMIQNSIPQPNMSAKVNVQNTNSLQNTQLALDSGNSISGSSAATQDSVTEANLSNLTVSSTSQMSPSGNVTTNLLQRINQTGTVESNPHISSSLMPIISLSVDSMKIEQNVIKKEGQNGNGGMHSNNGLTTTLVLHQAQAQHQSSQIKLNQVQQVAHQVDLRVQSILNQLGADQNAALNPQTKQSFVSFEDACKRLLRYHVFDSQTISEAQIKKVDGIFNAATESLLSRKKAIYDKYRLLILKQSMKIVPSNEEVMLDQIFIDDEHTFLKKERELFREYEAQLENMSFKQAKADFKIDASKTDCAPEYFAFGENSPKRNNVSAGLNEAANSRDNEDWLMDDKWNKSSRYPSVPDSEAATAIESILNEELS